MKLSRKLTLIAGSFAVLASPTSTVCAEPPANPDAGVIILMDRSGSMASKISNCAELSGEVYKWQCAAQKAINWITVTDTLTTTAGGAQVTGTYKYWFWQLRYFGVGDVVEKDAVQYDRQGILARLASYQGPTVDDASTPLAQIACDAMDMIRNENLPMNYLRLETDGLENASARTHKCYGIHSPTTYAATLGTLVTATYSDSPADSIVATVNALTVPSWESNMFAMGISGLLALAPAPAGYYTATQIQAYTPPTPNTPVLVDIDLFDDYVPTTVAALALSSAGRGVDTSPVAATASVASVLSTATTSSNYYDSYAAFLSGLAEVTGGRMIRYRLDNAGSSDVPSYPHYIPGDVDDSGCVDGTDLSALVSVFGQHVIQSNLTTYKADVTYDGVVDVHDYKLILANWGNGCSTAPSSPSLPIQVLFGFEDASKWSSPQATLGNKLSPISEGTYSLNLAGKGWREISSAAFSTETLQGVTSKIAYDVYIPTQQSNTAWLGQTLLFANCPSAGIYNLPMGAAVEFTGEPLGKFMTAKFTVPTNVKQAMLGSHSDFTLKIVINANDPGYILDTLRFVP
jgi:hypothetical protein